MTALTAPQFAAAARISLDTAQRWIDPLNATMEAYGIWSIARQAAFIAQCAHESRGFSRLEEDLNYSAARLMTVWPRRFPTAEIAVRYAHNPEKLGNFVYANRLGNGDEASGDGYRYRGRGPLMLTGATNYAEMSMALLGTDRLLHYPDHVAQDPWTGMAVAGRYWYARKLNDLADQMDFEGISRKVNGADIGLEDRLARTDHALTALA